MDRKLRVGILLDSMTITAWVFCLLETILQSDYSEIVLVVLNTPAQDKRSFWERLKYFLDHCLYTYYRKIDKMRFKAKPDAFEHTNASELLSGIPVFQVNPRRTKFSDYIVDQDIAEINKYEVDVFIRLGFRILRDKILKAAKFGIWSYHHGDNCLNRGGPAGFWEVLNNDPVTGSILQIISEDLDNGLLLYTSYSATHYISVNLNMNNFYWKTLSFIPRKLQEMHRIGPESFFNKINEQNRHPVFYSKRMFTTPTNSELIGPLIGYLGRYLKNKIYHLFFLEQWGLLFDLRDSMSTSLWRFKQIVPPKDRFWADPFIVFQDGRYYIFIEEYDYHQKKGHISLLTMDEKGSYTNPEKILERTYHLSYPFIFEYENEYYMIPETSAQRTIEVYHCVRFPDQWKFHMKLMENVHAKDVSLFFYNQKWWLFASIVEHAGAPLTDELFLFYSDTPLSNQWMPHPHNPIISDVRRARPAGQVFEHNGNYYRPSQNSMFYYGYGLKINHIVTLSEEAYEEQEVSSIEPGWDKNITGLHTLNRCNRLTITDCLIKRSKFLQ